MKIALDVMGFENDINEAIVAARTFNKKYKNDQIILVGDENKIKPHLKKTDHFDIIHTCEYLKMNDLPITALRKKNNSMLKAIDLIKNGQAQAIISAGSTSCFVPLINSELKKIASLKHFGFMPYLPTINKKGLMMIDVGANLSLDSQDLYNFALMANEYVRVIRKIPQPKIGVLNIGTEDHKGFTYHHEIDLLLKKNKNLKYVGFIESRDLLLEKCDICLCDGYSGNIALKAIEGSLITIAKILKNHYKKPWNWFFLPGAIPMFKTLIKTFDYRNYAAAIVLGINGIAIKTHGNADRKQFLAALQVAHECGENNFLNLIKNLKYE